MIANYAAAIRRAAAIAALAIAVTTPGRALADDADPKLTFERYQLDNGLTVILHQDNSVPLVAVSIWYHVAAGQEVADKSGFAHLFEHMLFQGSEHVGDDRHFAVLRSIGATTVNGTTSFDRTNYFEVVPSNQLETALWLESDRMGYFLPKLTEESLANQIEVVRNERRQRIENVPYGMSELAMYEMLYPEGHPYRYRVIGKHSDLTSSTLADVRAFYEKWYRPANGTLVIAGDFETPTAKALVTKWFGSFPKTAKPERSKRPIPVIKNARKVLDDEFAKLRRVTYAWNTPGTMTPGDAEMKILASAVAGKTGRLYKILVLDEQLAQSVAASQESAEFSSAFSITVTVKSGADLAKVEAIIEAELDKLHKTPINAAEFQRAVTQREAGFVWGLEQLISRANTLARYDHFVDEPNYITQDLDRYRKSSPEKIRSYVNKHLTKSQRAEIVTMPAEKGGK